MIRVSQMSTFRQFLRDLWSLTKPYWTSEDRGRAFLLLGVIVALNLGLVFINVLLNKWNAAFYDALQNKDYDEFVHQLYIFCGYAAVFILIAVYQIYLNQMLQIRWRRWLTENYLDAWLAKRTYYRMQLLDHGTDNPDQRIADDLRDFVSLTLTLTLSLLRQVVTLVSFLTILWNLSGDFSFTVGGVEIAIPGYMVWAALVYSVIGTWLTVKIGGPLARLNFNQQRFEADFRFGLVRFRENMEPIALYRGEGDERRGFLARFGHVVDNWWEIMRRQKKLTFFTAGYGQIATVFPIIVAAPRYFTGQIQLGQLMQTSSAFGQVQDAMSWIINAFTSLAEWKAVVDRLASFRKAIEAAETAEREDRIAVSETGADSLAVDGLTVRRPDGKILLGDGRLTLGRGESLLITGPSGSGKSTLFRALAGIWPFGEGTIQRPPADQTLFLPQKPYLPIASLRDVLLYPEPPADPAQRSDAALNAALAAVGLEGLAARLDDQQHWALQLSGGEQQRIALARALIQRPGWLFLDESTSAIDEPSETAIYQTLRRHLPDTTIVSIGHRENLKPLHDKVMRLVRPEDGGEPALVPAR